MRTIRWTLTALSVLLVCTGTGWAQSNITLVADADNTVRESIPDQNRGGNGHEIRSLTGARQRSAYIRFDLRVLGTEPQSNMTFTVTRQAGGAGSVAAGVVRAYGVPDLFGNTPQGWQEFGLTYNGTGLEVPGDGTTLTQDIDTNRLVFLAGLPASTSGGDEVLSISSPALDAFIIDRYNNGGLATIYLVEEDGISQTVYLYSNESTNFPPRLDVVSTLQALPPDTTPPTVAGVAPTVGETDVLPDVSVTVTFSEAMDAATVNSTNIYLLDDLSNTVPTALSYDGGTLTATLVPNAILDTETTYTAWVLGGSGGVKDASTNALAADFSWSFTTVADMIPPTVVSTSPTNGTVGVEYDVDSQVTFSEGMNAASIDTNTVYLLDESSNTVPALVVYDAGTFTATLYPVDPALDAGTLYTATVAGGPGGVTDLAGNPLATDYAWSFTTAPFNPYAPIDLYPVADTHVRHGTDEGVNYGTSGILYIRQLDTAPREFFGYVRFDLSSIPGPISDATFSLTKAGGDSLVNARFRVVGLDNVAGNTDQNWDEYSLVFTNVGLEVDTSIYPTPDAGESPFDFTRVTDFEEGTTGIVETVTGTGAGNTASISGSTLVAWLEARRLDGGLATLMVDFPANGGGSGSSRRVEYATKEHVIFAPPRLHLEFQGAPIITDVELTAGPSVVVTWLGSTTHTYAIERTISDLTASNWNPVATNLSISTLQNTYTDAAPVEAQVSYRVVDEGATEAFFDDFEGADMGWTVVQGTNHVAGTDWELGTPPPSVGPGAAYSGTNCYGTNVDDFYASNAEISLVSPQIDLTSASAADLSFANYYDTEPYADPFGDLCEVYVRDAAGGEITGLESPIETYDDLITPIEWQTETIPLPAGALGQIIRIEFRFISDGGVEYDGWYIDDVRVGG